MEERVRYLENINRLTLDALDQAAQLGDFQTSINKMDSAKNILKESYARIHTLIPFDAVAFFLVNEQNSEFYLSDCMPDNMDRFFSDNVDRLVENGTFAWAIREKRPIFVSAGDNAKKLLLRVLSTASRTRGMFVGLLPHGEKDVPLISLSLLSIILLHSANALESFELYGMIKGINRSLEHTVAERTRELQQSQEQLRHAQKMEALGRLAGGVAHDFNNILTSITIATEVSLAHPSLPDDIGRNFREILEISERASNLTKQLLAMSRKQSIKPRIFEVDALMEDNKNVLTRLIPESIAVTLEVDCGLPCIEVDPGQLQQVLMNLAVNAVDAIRQREDPGEKKISIRVCSVQLGASEVEQKLVDREGDFILIRFSDTGVGMTGEVCQRIFEPFFTTKDEEHGTGLGMAMVYGILKQNDGGITVHSTPGQGTIFNIYWPAADSCQVDKDPVDAADGFPRGTETLLLVEDDCGIRATLEQLLLALGYTVLTASDGREALELTLTYENQIHLLLTDITMPVLDGRNLARKLTEKIPDLKVILTTGYVEDLESIRRSSPPDYGFLPKPYNVTRVTRMVRDILDDKVSED